MFMARNRTFHEDDVVNAVADVFVANGYKGTSIQMLAEATGLGKQSLYNAFGDKEALYLKSLDCAGSRYLEVMEQMRQAATGRDALQMFFDHIAQRCASTSAAENACIVSIGLLEDIDQATISTALHEKWLFTQAMLKREIARGQRDGSIANTTSPNDLADFLMSLMSGMRVNARAVPDARRIKRAIAAGMQVLDAH
jgi:TetR/AcrR family transcriptional regulator, transcriptional repressor for nem operon